MRGKNLDLSQTHQAFPNSSGSLAMPTASKTVEMEIYRAGRTSPIECSSVLYETVEAANRAVKAALKQLLTEFPD